MDCEAVRIGLMDNNVAELKGGPLVFMERLKEGMINKGVYSEDNFNKWINLSFKTIPKEVLNNKEDIEIIVRFDGVYNASVLPNKIRLSLKNICDKAFFKYINNKIVRNYIYADKVIYQSEFSKFHIEELLLKRFKVDLGSKKTKIIYNGIDINKFKPEVNLRNTANFPNILVSHRMVPNKRAHQIPQIISKLRNYYPNLKVHVAGKGVKNPIYFNENSLDYFKKQVKALGLENYFCFYGYLEPKYLPEIYNRCDCMLNLSYIDPCPNVVIEAMACGLPVIAPNSGGIPELIGTSELLVNEEIDLVKFYPMFCYEDLPKVDSDKYVEKILQVLEKHQFYSQYCRDRVEKNFNINNIIDEYISFACE